MPPEAPAMHVLLEEFLAKEPHPETIEALRAFLTSPRPARSPATWIPPADEAETRLGLVRQLRQNIIATTTGSDQTFQFTSAQVSALFLAPLSRLQYFVTMTAPDKGASERDMYAGSIQSSLTGLHDNIRYFLQGQHPDAASKKRKTPGQEPQPVEGPRGENPVQGTDYVSRNEQEKKKCLARDQHRCIFTSSIHPQACHIVPFAFNSTRTNQRDYTTRFAINIQRLFFASLDEEESCLNLLSTGLGSSDKAWNMLSINPYLHAWWARPYWAVECLGIEPVENGYAVILAFHWMPHSDNDITPDQPVRLESDMLGTLDALADRRSYGDGLAPDKQGFPNAIQHDSFQPIVSGQEFRVVHETPEDAQRMRKMVDIQWACVRLAAMSGAAGPSDDDDDWSEFDFEREEYETAVFLGYIERRGRRQ
ncbi:hypothetical protein SEUCBS140593_005563 [Sporothrix eucalyptigena]|uniref:HNH nuclease domain-containing protein n=1 Tax=Sporothrix eucalyptigena TaxID=1812306 RepID=A0ABP0BXV9_9PEZI